ncbi:hypothetical protein ACLMJK_008704 [Lecanora helva]
MNALSIKSLYKLNNGLDIPYLGLGVYASTTCAKACLTSFDEGYRQIDCAQLYGNEAEVGEAVRTSSLPRSSIFVTSKVWDPKHTRSASYNAVLESLKLMKLDYIDLYLVHNPRSGPSGRHAAWLGLQDAVQAGKVKSIGVSNFTPGHIDALMKHEDVSIKPAVNQIEFHPWNQQKTIVEYCRKEGIAVQAYSPLTQGHKLGDPVIGEVAKKHKKTPAQVVLRWVLQQGVIAIPKSENPGRIRENAGIYDFELDEEDLRRIEGLDQGQKGNIGVWNPFAHE